MADRAVRSGNPGGFGPKAVCSPIPLSCGEIDAIEKAGDLTLEQGLRLVATVRELEAKLARTEAALGRLQVEADDHARLRLVGDGYRRKCNARPVDVGNVEGGREAVMPISGNRPKININSPAVPRIPQAAFPRDLASVVHLDGAPPGWPVVGFTTDSDSATWALRCNARHEWREPMGTVTECPVCRSCNGIGKA